jgi:hypothetical protein
MNISVDTDIIQATLLKGCPYSSNILLHVIIIKVESTMDNEVGAD